MQCRPMLLGLLAVFLAAIPWLHAGATTAYDRDAIKGMVAREARNMAFPVALALAVAHAESDFDPRAESRKGARGVMQIMPRTALGEYAIPVEMLWDPRVNIWLGIHFLKRLIRRYRGRTALALSFYNGGSAVGEMPNARVIPATAPYVRKVRRLQREYRHALRSRGQQRWIRQRLASSTSKAP